MSLAWNTTAHEKMPASPQLTMISEVGGVDIVRQLSSEPEAVVTSDSRSMKLPTIGHRLTAPSDR